MGFTVIMPLATVCPKCAYRWTIVELVSRSWSCPRCGSGRSGVVEQLTCVCGHRYAEHETKIPVENSLEAFSLSGDALPDGIDALPGRAAPLPAPVGRCTVCRCDAYRR